MEPHRLPQGKMQGLGGVHHLPLVRPPRRLRRERHEPQVPDRLIEQAPRLEQLELFGLTGAGIARRITALQNEESLEAR